MESHKISMVPNHQPGFFMCFFILFSITSMDLRAPFSCGCLHHLHPVGIWATGHHMHANWDDQRAITWAADDTAIASRYWNCRCRHNFPQFANIEKKHLLFASGSPDDRVEICWNRLKFVSGRAGHSWASLGCWLCAKLLADPFQSCWNRQPLMCGLGDIRHRRGSKCGDSDGDKAWCISAPSVWPWAPQWKNIFKLTQKASEGIRRHPYQLQNVEQLTWIYMNYGWLFPHFLSHWYIMIYLHRYPDPLWLLPHNFRCLRSPRGSGQVVCSDCSEATEDRLFQESGLRMYPTWSKEASCLVNFTK